MTTQRDYLEAMGIDLWVRRDRPPPPVADAVESVAAAAAPVAAPAPADLGAPLAPAAPAPTTDDDVAALDWDVLAARVNACTRCDELVRNRTQTVFGVGDRQAEWLFIGEAPGADEDRLGEPFVGRAGKLLDAMHAALSIERGKGVYIANVLKCRPPNNRDPRPEESRNCRSFLNRQIALIRPRIIVALGRIAAQNLLDTDTPIGKLRGKTWQYEGIPLVVTYHPAYLLRSPGEKRKAWDDLLMARRIMSGAAGP